MAASTSSVHAGDDLGDRATPLSGTQLSFDAAARSLHVSVSALSQRLTGLERSVGHPVVTRGRPVRVTEPGRAVLKLAREIDWLLTEHERSAGRPTTLTLAVNADSLSTWFAPMLRWFARAEVLIDLRIEDQDRTAQLLERAEVVAAVSTRAEPPTGCRAAPLGRMRYLPACAPELLPPDGLPADGLTEWLADTPTLRFDADDALPDAFAQLQGLSPGRLRAHLVPSNREYLDAVRAGLGWSVLPEAQVADDLVTGRLVRLPTEATVDVALHWHRWRVGSDLLDAMDDEVRRCAARALHGYPG